MVDRVSVITAHFELIAIYLSVYESDAIEKQNQKGQGKGDRAEHVVSAGVHPVVRDREVIPNRFTDRDQISEGCDEDLKVTPPFFIVF